jgi:hypothetical protein
MSKVNTLLKQWECVTQKESHEKRHSKMEITYIFTLGIDSFKEFQSFGMMIGVNHIQDE